jgi:DNA-binding NarL/FixJ family response regulator
MKLLLIEDHPLFRQGFAAMLAEARPGWVMSGAASSAEGQAMLASDPEIDLVLVDLQLPDLDGFETLVRLAQINPTVARMIISGRGDMAAQQRARQAGAGGFIVKSDGPEAIIAQIEAVAAGGTGFATPIDPDHARPTLTARQCEVLGLLGEGCANKEIRFRLGIAERTVRAHLTELFGALRVHSRVQAILRARALGLIP